MMILGNKANLETEIQVNYLTWISMITEINTMVSKTLADIKAASVEARRTKSPNATFLVTLYSEAAKVGKDKRNGESTEDEVLSVLRKFKVGAETIIEAATKQQGPKMLEQIAQAQLEISIVESYLPKLMSEGELRNIITRLVLQLTEKSPKQMGAIMAELKRDFANEYDGALASKLVKEALV